MTTRGRADARFSAVEKVLSRKVRRFDNAKKEDGSILITSEFFGCNTFNFDLLSQKISASDLHILKSSAASEHQLSNELADTVATSIKEWALKKGATHFCHWFQPQTGVTAGKHDAFLSYAKNGEPIEKFRGRELLQSEPDASSFPSGGMRSTFEARGYTAWDSSSPVFLMETENGLTLFIPAIFISYTGEALDEKTPLLRSVKLLSKSAKDALSLLGHSKTEYVIVTCGPEQEYFVVDNAFFGLRPDLQLAGRTLVGRIPPKGQQLEDHYFGDIKPRILNYMLECEHELYKLGVPCKTRHNEVAPSQYEIAPMFEQANVAADHNQLVMEIMRVVGRRHDLVPLFHEKPYFGMNGSGKHLNWSMADSNGINLLEPGERPEQNIRFLYFVAATLSAVHSHGDLIRFSVASAGNDFRLGANEAPPAIMSVFLGEALTDILEKLGTNQGQLERQREINMGLAKVPIIAKDNTDRNRTSPFAFTGNKFEFRAPGSSASICSSATYINTAVADVLTDMNSKLRKIAGSNQPTNDQILKVITETYRASKKICFEGNNYSAEWHKEAEKRGLPNLKDTPTALKVIKNSKNVSLLLKNQIYHSKEEIDARYSVLVDRFAKVRLIELETMLELVSSHILPSANLQLAEMRNTFEASKVILKEVPTEQADNFKRISTVMETLCSQRNKLEKLLSKAQVVAKESEEKLAELLSDDALHIMSEIRESSNELELLVDDNLWSLPKCREMIYSL